MKLGSSVRANMGAAAVNCFDVEWSIEKREIEVLLHNLLDPIKSLFALDHAS